MEIPCCHNIVVSELCPHTLYSVNENSAIYMSCIHSLTVYSLTQLMPHTMQPCILAQNSFTALSFETLQEPATVNTTAAIQSGSGPVATSSGSGTVPISSGQPTEPPTGIEGYILHISHAGCEMIFFGRGLLSVTFLSHS